MASGKRESLSPKQQLIMQLQDEEYRKGFVEGHATDTIAFQLKAMRKAKNWEQRDVAEKLGNRKLQPMISRYENPDYGKYSMSTLLELAAAFDVALAVRFLPFSELVEWDSSSNPAKVCPPSFADDKRLDQIAEETHSPNGIFAVLRDIDRQGSVNQSAASAASGMNQFAASAASGMNQFAACAASNTAAQSRRQGAAA